MKKTSRLHGFYKLSIDERLKIVREFAGLTEEETLALKNFGNLREKLADIMIENVIGAMSYPFAIAVNFMINGKEYLIPMVLEEPPVVAAASNAARFMRRDGGIKARAVASLMIG